MEYHAIINDRGELAFPSMSEAARWTTWKEANAGAHIVISDTDGHTAAKPRTLSQNAALHLYFEQVATALNDAGYPIQKTLQSYKAEIDWSKESVKEIIWRPAQQAILGKSSTTELSKHDEITKVWETVNRFLAQLGVESVPFPSHEPGYYDTAPLKSDV